MLLKAYAFKISHIPEKENVLAEFLSRKPMKSIITPEEMTDKCKIMFIHEAEAVKAECVVAETA